MQGPGYALGQFLAGHGAHVTIHKTTYIHEARPGDRPAGEAIISEHVTATLPDGTQVGMDVRFEEDA
jgi:hypothetical protein